MYHITDKRQITSTLYITTVNNYDLARIIATFAVFIGQPTFMQDDAGVLKQLFSSFFYDKESETSNADALEEWCSMANPELVNYILNAYRSDVINLEISAEIFKIASMDMPYSILNAPYLLENKSVGIAFSVNAQEYFMTILERFEEMNALVLD